MFVILKHTYLVLITVGLIIPILDISFGFFGSLLNVDFKLGRDRSFKDSLHFNLMALCFAILVFGSLGLLTYGGVGYITLLPIVVFNAAISFKAYKLINKHIILRLYELQPLALTEDDLIDKHGIITLSVEGNGLPGTVSVEDSTGASITYKARAKDEALIRYNGVIKAGKLVKVEAFDVENKICWVTYPEDKNEIVELEFTKHLN